MRYGYVGDDLSLINVTVTEEKKEALKLRTIKCSQEWRPILPSLAHLLHTYWELISDTLSMYIISLYSQNREDHSYLTTEEAEVRAAVSDGHEMRTV